MTDSREERAALEAAQTELRDVRAALAVPPDFQAIRAEADALIAERRQLTSQLDRLRDDAYHARITVLAVKTDRPLGGFVHQASRFGIVMAFAGAVALGTRVGLYLERWSLVPPWAALTAAGAVGLYLFTDLTAFVRWLKT